MASSKDPITTHVLNTVNGRPGQGIPVSLTLLSPHKYQSAVFSASTNTDGRIAKWSPKSGDTSIDAVFQESSEGRLLWKLTFEIEEFYGEGNTLYKTIDLNVYSEIMKEGPGHLHVPLLLGPWSYTTYRGS